jgi:hypothetical protein
MNINFKDIDVEYNEAIDGDIVEISFDEDSNEDPFNRTKCYICISQNYEFRGEPTLEWHDGKDYDGGSGIENYNLTKDIFELETTDGLSFKIYHSCPNKVLVQIQEFLDHKFNGNKKA